MISEKLKSVIFDKLYQDLKHCEIIPYDGSIYIIDRDNKFWYFEYDKGGTLWWRYDFFNTFFELFSLTYKQFQSILGEWVEEVLNYKVLDTKYNFNKSPILVEEILNYKVLTTATRRYRRPSVLEEVLNCKVLITEGHLLPLRLRMEEVLNCKALTTNSTRVLANMVVEEILNYKVLTTKPLQFRRPHRLEEVLNCNESKT